MSDLRTAANQMLEALEGGADSWQLVGPAIDALKEALVEEPGLKPAGVITSMVKGGVTWHVWPDQMPNGTTLYAAAPIIKPEIKEDKPFGYFRAEPFGWTDCAPTDEGAIPLYFHFPHVLGKSRLIVAFVVKAFS